MKWFQHLFNHPLVKKHFGISIFGFVLGILVFYYISYGEGYEKLSFLAVVSSGICGGIVVYAVYLSTLWLDKRLPWQTNLGSRLLSGIILHSALGFSVSAAFSYFYMSLSEVGSKALQNFNPIAVKLAIIVFILVFIYAIVYFALYSYHMYAGMQVKSIQLERKQIDLQLRALKSQLSPHFLFNNLNTISSLMHKDVLKASVFIRKMARSYQYTLTSYNKRTVPLKEELGFVDSYQHLLQTRFENNVQLSVEIPSGLFTTKVPPLTLQMLVENAGKHNQVSEKYPLKILIKANNKWIWVSNNKTTTPNKIDSFKIGLKNINARYELLTGRGIEVIDNENFTVRMPVIYE